MIFVHVEVSDDKLCQALNGYWDHDILGKYYFPFPPWFSLLKKPTAYVSTAFIYVVTRTLSRLRVPFLVLQNSFTKWLLHPNAIAIRVTSPVSNIDLQISTSIKVFWNVEIGDLKSVTSPLFFKSPHFKSRPLKFLSWETSVHLSSRIEKWDMSFLLFNFYFFPFLSSFTPSKISIFNLPSSHKFQISFSTYLFFHHEYQQILMTTNPQMKSLFITLSVESDDKWIGEKEPLD